MNIRNKYNAIDVMKLFMAFLVVGIHVGSSFDTLYPVGVCFILEMAVPFFFVCSGFFIQNKIEKTGNCMIVLKQSCKRYLKLYLLWHIVYFPIALRFIFASNHDIFDNFLYCLRRFLFVGEYFYSWPLWYLHGLIVSIIFVFMLYRCRLSLVQIWIISVLMMLIGYFVKNIAKYQFDISIKEVCQSLIYLLGSADRNGPFRGFALVCTGMMIQKYSSFIRHRYALGILCITTSYILYINNLPYYLLFSGFGIFIIASSIFLKDNPCYFSFRIHSTLIYFIHMYFVVFTHMLLKETIISVINVYLIWIAVSFFTWIISILINKLRKKEKYLWINNFI